MFRKMLVKAVAATLIGSMSMGVVAESPDSGAKGRWGWDGRFASTSFENGLSLGVFFAADEGCDIAYFFLAGNDEIDEMGWRIDNTRFKKIPVEPIEIDNVGPVVTIPLTSTALSSIKGGYSLTIYTDEGDLPVSLSGSAASLNGAYANCMEIFERGRLKPTSTKKVEKKKESNPLRRVLSETADYTLTLQSYEGKLGLVFEGVITTGLADKVISAIEKYNPKALHIKSSEGGRLFESIKIGKALRDNGVITISSGMCASACVTMFAGGEHRLATPTAKFGFHRMSDDSDNPTLTFADGQEMVAGVYAYYSSMGVDPSLVIAGSLIKSDDMIWASDDDLKEYNIVTSEF